MLTPRQRLFLSSVQRRRRVYVVASRSGYEAAAAVILEASACGADVGPIREVESKPQSIGRTATPVLGFSGDTTPKFGLDVCPTLRSQWGGRRLWHSLRYGVSPIGRGGVGATPRLPRWLYGHWQMGRNCAAAGIGKRLCGSSDALDWASAGVCRRKLFDASGIKVVAQWFSLRYAAAVEVSAVFF